MNQPLEVKDFSGGMTDNYLAGPSNKGKLFDNLLINNNRKPFTRFGSIIRDSTHYQTPSGVKRIAHIWDHRDQLMEQVERNIYYNDGSYNTLLGPTSNPALSVNAEDDHISRAFWNNHSLVVSDSFCLPVKIYKDDSDIFQVRTAGMPSIAAPTVTEGSSGAGSYIYGFLYYYSYNVEGVTFEDLGPTVQVQISSAAAPDSSSVSITNIPVISNSLTGNYDTSNIKVKIYRTEVNQTVLKYIGEVTNGTTSYTDSASDSSITNNVDIYTTGDVVDNDPPPPAKFVHIANDIALYGFVEEDGVQIPNRVRQSIKGDIDACPADFFDDFPEDLFGISSIQGTFIVFGKNSTYRLDGFFDEQGRGGITHLRISDTVGTVSNDSVVQTDEGLFFAGLEGWFFCDGYKIVKISHHLNETFKTLVVTTSQARNIWGAYDKIEKRVWWAVQKNQASLDNDSCFILDLTWGITEESTFTTASNGNSFAPTALYFKEGNMYRADKRGYIFLHSSSYFSDPKVDITKAASVWAKKTIIHDYQSCAFDFGTSFVRKFVPKILITLANITNIAIQAFSNNDEGKRVAPLVEIRHYSSIIWGDPERIWGDPTLIWNKTGLIEEKRNFPAKGLRCNYKQIRITNSFTIIGSSDLSGLVTIDPILKTATFVNAHSVWPTDSVGYFLTLENDDYEQQFEIVTRTSDSEVVLMDALDLLPTADDYKWELKGYRKGEFMELLSYVIHYKMLTDSQRTFHNPSDTGANT